jgi:serine/threonine-protein kinase RsbT
LIAAALRARSRGRTSNREVTPELVAFTMRGVSLFCDASGCEKCQAELMALVERADPTPIEPVELRIEREADIVVARDAARSFAANLGFEQTDQVKISTVVSELTRNIFMYARRGTIRLDGGTKPAAKISIEARDDGPGIANVAEILAGRNVSKSGLGRGLIGSKRLMDDFVIDTGPGRGTCIRATKTKRS